MKPLTIEPAALARRVRVHADAIHQDARTLAALADAISNYAGELHSDAGVDELHQAHTRMRSMALTALLSAAAVCTHVGALELVGNVYLIAESDGVVP
jgi:hypothetical protein